MSMYFFIWTEFEVKPMRYEKNLFRLITYGPNVLVCKISWRIWATENTESFQKKRFSYEFGLEYNRSILCQCRHPQLDKTQNIEVKQIVLNSFGATLLLLSKVDYNNQQVLRKTDWLLAFVGICLVIFSEGPPLSHWLLWFWWIE